MTPAQCFWLSISSPNWACVRALCYKNLGVLSPTVSEKSNFLGICPNPNPSPLGATPNLACKRAYVPLFFGCRYRPQIGHAYEPLTRLYVTKIWESYLQLFPRNRTFWEFAPTLTLTPRGNPKLGMQTRLCPLITSTKFQSSSSYHFWVMTLLVLGRAPPLVGACVRASPNVVCWYRFGDRSPQKC